LNGDGHFDVVTAKQMKKTSKILALFPIFMHNKNIYYNFIGIMKPSALFCPFSTKVNNLLEIIYYQNGLKNHHSHLYQ